jgi:hypothetical protein
VVLMIPMLYTPLMRTHPAGPSCSSACSGWPPPAFGAHLIPAHPLPGLEAAHQYLPALMCLERVSVSNTGRAGDFATSAARSCARRNTASGESGHLGKQNAMACRRPRRCSELLLGIYSLLSFALSFSDKILPSPFMLIYTAGFFYVFTLSLRHSLTPAMQGGNRR